MTASVFRDKIRKGHKVCLGNMLQASSYLYRRDWTKSVMCQLCSKPTWYFCGDTEMVEVECHIPKPQQL